MDPSGHAEETVLEEIVVHGSRIRSQDPGMVVLTGQAMYAFLRQMSILAAKQAASFAIRSIPVITGISIVLTPTKMADSTLSEDSKLYMEEDENGEDVDEEEVKVKKARDGLDVDQGKSENGTRKGDLPGKAEPNSTKVKDDGNGNGQIREYGPDGRAKIDYDFGHDHGAGDPHAHDWDWTKTPPRQPGRHLHEGE